MDPVPVSLLLDKVSRASAARLSRRIEGLGVRPKHVGLLAAVEASGSSSQADVGTWLGIGPSAVVALVDDAVDRGLVVRVPDLQNRRRVRILLTDRGRDVYAESRRIAVALDEELLAESDGQDRAVFSAVLARLASSLHVGGR